MRLALLSDIHANLRALEACLAHARAQGATHFALLGDLVGYGPEPGAVVDRAMALAQAGAIVLQGNHDELAVHGGEGPTIAHLVARWTHDRLSVLQRAWLQSLPLTATLGPLLVVHATADDPPAWQYIRTAHQAQRSLDAAAGQPGIRLVFGGHVHTPALWYANRRGDLLAFAPTPGAPIALARHRRWLATVGSVGQPRDGDPRAAYALWDDGAGSPGADQLTFHRVPYDHAAAAEAVRRGGLPEAFARRLLEAR